MTGGSGVIIRRPSVAESLRILLGNADCDGALGVVEMALSPGASGPPVNGNRKLISCRQLKFDQFRVHLESAVSAGARPRSRFLSR
jgi:hypothetical protein